MIVVIVAQEHHGDRWQILEADRGLTDAPGTDDAERAGVLGIDRIGEEVTGLRLDQERRVADESDHRRRGVECWRSLHDDRDTPRPRTPTFTQQPWHRGERLTCLTPGVEESSSVEMIVHA